MGGAWGGGSSGLINQLAEVILSYMILNCWTKSGALDFIKTLKFLELVGENMLAVTNLVICINLALIVAVSETSI